MKSTSQNNPTVIPNKTPHHSSYQTKYQDYQADTKNTAHLPFGNLMTTKEDGNIRLYLQNINGAKLSYQQEAWQYATDYIKEHNIDYAGLVETRIEWNTKNQTIVKKQLQKTFTHSSLSTSMCRTHVLNEGTPGGTACIITNQLVNRKTNNIIDESGLGRWTGATFALPSYKLHIITCYRPNKDNKVNSNTTYQQQIRILKQQGNDNPNPNKQVIQDLLQLIQTLERQNDKIILMWDANDSLDHPSLQEFQTKSNLVSLLPIHPEDLSTYTRGKKVIDHILGSKELVTMVTKAGYLPFYEGAWISDHRPLFIDIQAKLKQPKPQPRKYRNLASTNHKAVKKFIQTIQSTSNTTNLLQALLDLELKHTWTEEDHNQLEKIDKELTNLLVTAETSLHAPYDTPWSPYLHEMYEIHRYWQIQKMRKNNKIKNTPTLQHLETKYRERL
jgi:hypothetical protein